MENTPGPAGYLLAWAVSVVVFAALFAAGTSVGEGTGAGTALGVFVIYGYVIGSLSIPFAVVGVALVHLACVRVPAQWVHVLAAGAVGLLPAALFLLVDPSLARWLAVGVPIATAIGRWSVVPLVRRRRAGPVSPAARATS